LLLRPRPRQRPRRGRDTERSRPRSSSALRHACLTRRGPVNARVAGPAAKGSRVDPVRALQHALYRAAKADPGRRQQGRPAAGARAPCSPRSRSSWSSHSLATTAAAPGAGRQPRRGSCSPEAAGRGSIRFHSGPATTQPAWRRLDGALAAVVGEVPAHHGAVDRGRDEKVLSRERDALDVRDRARSVRHEISAMRSTRTCPAIPTSPSGPRRALPFRVG
jgi:hypothetical protein